MLKVGVCEREPLPDLGLFLSGRQGCGGVAYCCDEFGQALGFVPCACLFSEVLHTMGVGVCGMG
ncbi:hypothetical protein ACIQM4_00595 [Streptomyces sp. NPDC091272]|uniref:hypothetical protein n=1 Tax=Streptomyces sp. NPDC091272 TaxID=3365981 RepID=UPI0037F78C72